jgi:purine-nucleoside phosphorylase
MLDKFISIEQIDRLKDAIAERTSYNPKVGIILGSGLGPLAERVSNPDRIPYTKLPSWPISTVPGHQGQLVIGELEGQSVLIMQGRTHYYEGYPMPYIGLPIRVMQRMGVEILIVTNAAGAINPEFQPGDVMLIIDHLNLIGMAGLSPLRGPNLDMFGPRFPDMSNAYDSALSEAIRQVAAANNIMLREGVYAGLAGPSFETPADLRFLNTIGADAVGMSTVPEVTVARHGGQRVLGISGISNKANLDGSTVTTHEEVLEAGQIIVPKLETLIQGVLRTL